MDVALGESVVLLFLFLLGTTRTSSGEKHCRLVSATFGERRRNCTSTEVVSLVRTNISSLEWFKEVKEIKRQKAASWIAKERPVVIIKENHMLLYNETTFFPKLKKVDGGRTKLVGVTGLIKDNRRLCIPEKRRRELIQMFHNDIFIQPCTCFSTGKSRMNGNVSVPDIIGGDYCEIIYGDVVLEDTVYSDFLEKRLSRVKKIFGRLVIKNTSLTNLKFLRNLSEVIANVTREDPSVEIINNSELKTLNLLLSTVTNSHDLAPLVFINFNPKLQGEEMEIYFLMKQMTKVGNSRVRDPVIFEQGKCFDYQQEGLDLNKENIIESCVGMEGDLLIEGNQNISKLERKLARMRTIFGCITIRNTNLTEIHFMSQLTTVSCSKNRSAIIIEGNQQLRKISVVASSILGHNRFAYEFRNNSLLCESEADFVKAVLRRTDSPIKTVFFEGKSSSHCEAAPAPPEFDRLITYISFGIAAFLVFSFCLGTEYLVRRRKRMKRLLEQ